MKRIKTKTEWNERQISDAELKDGVYIFRKAGNSVKSARLL